MTFNSIQQLVFIMQARCVYCEVGTEFLCTFYVTLRLPMDLDKISAYPDVYRVGLWHRHGHRMLHWHRHRLWHRNPDDLHLLLLVTPIATIISTPTGPLATAIAADATLLDRVLILDCFSVRRSSQDGEDEGHLRHSLEMPIMYPGGKRYAQSPRAPWTLNTGQAFICKTPFCQYLSMGKYNLCFRRAAYC